MHKAVFLDRDGVVNEDVHHLNNLEELRILPGVSAAIKNLNERGYKVIVVTNQGGIAKGLIPHEVVGKIHEEIVLRLEKDGAHIDAIYYCPHHPEGVIAEYAIVCNCRKPKPGMIDMAIRDLGLDPSGSYLVGDKMSDIIAGKGAGLVTILVNTSDEKADEKNPPDFFADDLGEAIKFIR